MPNIHERIPIVSHSGCTIYGRVIGTTGKLGLYEVFSDYWGTDGTVYHQFARAETRFNEIVDRNKKKDKS